MTDLISLRAVKLGLAMLFLASTFVALPALSSAAEAKSIAKIIEMARRHGPKVAAVYGKFKKYEQRLREKANKALDAALKADDNLKRNGGAVGAGVRVGFEQPQTTEYFSGSSKDIRIHGFKLHPLVAKIYSEEGARSHPNAGKCVECVIFTKELEFLEVNGYKEDFKKQKTWYGTEDWSEAGANALSAMLATFVVVKRVTSSRAGSKRKNIEACPPCEYASDRLGAIDLNRSYSKKDVVLMIVRYLDASLR